jgi:hypothetical protein
MSIQLSQDVAHSADGTPIGYVKLGTGPGLVIVHGSVTTGDEWPAFKDFRSAVDRNELDEALTIDLRDLVRMSSDEIAGLRWTPFWPGMAALTPTWTRECVAIDLFEFGVSRHLTATADFVAAVAHLSEERGT